MPNTLKAANGRQSEVTSSAGPQSYISGGGFSIRSDLGRVDEATVETPTGSWDARVDSVVGNNSVVVKVYSASTGIEAPDDEDLSGSSFTLTAHRL